MADDIELQAHLTAIATGETRVLDRGRTYTFSKPLVAPFLGSQMSCGLRGNGAILRYSGTAAVPALSFVIGPDVWVRYFTLDDLTLIGPGQAARVEGQDGIAFIVPGTGDQKNGHYRSLISAVNIEAFGDIGLHAAGAFFENTVTDCNTSNNRGAGMVFETTGPGVCSDVRVRGGSQQGNLIGLRGIGCSDLSLDGIKFLENQEQGCTFDSGVQRMVCCNFENNWQSKNEDGSFQTGSAIWGQTDGIIENCAFGAEFGGQTSFIQWYVTSMLKLHDCNGQAVCGDITGSGFIEPRNIKGALTVNGPMII